MVILFKRNYGLMRWKKEAEISNNFLAIDFSVSLIIILTAKGLSYVLPLMNKKTKLTAYDTLTYTAKKTFNCQCINMDVMYWNLPLWGLNSVL